MSHSCRSILVLSILALAVAVPAMAQTPPPGSYKLTCTGISMSGTTLNATCNARGGNPVATSLGFAAGCVGDIANVNGTLACTGANGSFHLTCRNAVVEGHNLTAECKNKKGVWVKSTLPNFIGFDHNISNCDGKLQNTACP